ncbi:hypothetical protein SAMN05216567_108107 [Variovorax sp. OK605]|jgi:hypothetical protein|uniref:hypothetical protein n=1 Tax=unclassified Variovorax TaxID=663243 RepID=UPI0008AD7789|nr:MULTISPECIES: hypothetical protein [unclassified Variovorax]SEK01805.1 hypothetical protein SAMN05518853_106102 [Variovorax sp. OK202]SFD32311.1 hypothetical protein SAMN05444746_106102 [Variovorax sp. OK212]SFP71376.1 hypothetical protein SAMN05216567_108107 [Variovorax sp. OK605]
MFENTAPREQPYTVRLEGNNLSIRDLMEVRFTFLRLLEQRIGAPTRVVKCYRAWASQLESGSDALTDAQITLARAWRDAWDHASEMAGPLLSNPHTTAFQFELFR